RWSRRCPCRQAAAPCANRRRNRHPRNETVRDGRRRARTVARGSDGPLALAALGAIPRGTRLGNLPRRHRRWARRLAPDRLDRARGKPDHREALVIERLVAIVLAPAASP